MSNGMIKVGDAVLLSRNRLGIIRYYGKTQFAAGNWFGIELIDSSLARHNGMILNKQYFKCPPNKGLFVRRDCIQKVMKSDAKPTKKRTYSLKLNLQNEKKQHRIPKYKLDKENERLKSLAQMASQHQNEFRLLNKRKHHRYPQHLDIIPIERIPNELLSDNESIELSSRDAVVIERNLMNYGDKECKHVVIDNFIRDLNDIEYSFSLHHEACNNDPPQMVPVEISNDNIRHRLRYDDDYQIQSRMFPIEGDEQGQTGGEKPTTYDGYSYYFLIRYGLLPCLVYSSINALIVCAMYLLFNANRMQLHWRMDIEMDIHIWLDGAVHIPSLLSIDLWITTVVESISIWFFVTMLVQKDLKKGNVSRIDARLNDVCCDCFLSNHNMSLCKRWMRNMVCAFVWMVCAIIVFYVPITVVLHKFMNAQHISKFDYIQMVIFKGSYGGVIAFVVSPITACFTLL